MDNTIDQALAEAARRDLAIHTFALYYDHESPAISVCIDTAESSRRTVADINAYNRKYFEEVVAAGDLKTAALWEANIGRSLSLGDFALFGAARAELAPDFEPDPAFFLLMMQRVMAAEGRIAVLAKDRSELVLCCTGPDDEVEYCWSLGERRPARTPAAG